MRGALLVGVLLAVGGLAFAALAAHPMVAGYQSVGCIDTFDDSGGCWQWPAHRTPTLQAQLVAGLLFAVAGVGLALSTRLARTRALGAVAGAGLLVAAALGLAANAEDGACFFAECGGATCPPPPCERGPFLEGPAVGFAAVGLAAWASVPFLPRRWSGDR